MRVRVQRLGDLAELVQVPADDQHPVFVVAAADRPDRIQSLGQAGRRVVAHAVVSYHMGHPLVRRHGKSDLEAHRWGDPAGGLQFAPGRVVALGPDQAEDVVLPPILPDQDGGQPEATLELDLGCIESSGEPLQVLAASAGVVPAANGARPSPSVSHTTPQRVRMTNLRHQPSRASILGWHQDV